MSFRKEALAPRGGPDGGDGGRGGDVIFRVDSRLHSLLDLRIKRKYQAGNGRPGMGRNCDGPDGEDLIIKVPPGTVVKGPDGDILVDLSEEGDSIFLKGGLGGRGNTFYKSSVNQAPGVAQKGLPGEERELHLELKLLADVGIIGYPNAGKSTLISRISAAKPKVADYPFTTLVPNLGVVKVAEGRSFVVADIPGLIPGAHEGVGLGIQFLRHIERTRLFLHVIDASGFSGRDPYQDYFDINAELKAYDEIHESDPAYKPLYKREQIVVLNKIDAVDASVLAEVEGKFATYGVRVRPISAVAGTNIEGLVYQLGEKVFEGSDDK